MASPSALFLLIGLVVFYPYHLGLLRYSPYLVRFFHLCFWLYLTHLHPGSELVVISCLMLFSLFPWILLLTYHMSKAFPVFKEPILTPPLVYPLLSKNWKISVLLTCTSFFSFPYFCKLFSLKITNESLWGSGNEEWLLMGKRFLLGLMNMFWNLVVVMVLQV